MVAVFLFFLITTFFLTSANSAALALAIEVENLALTYLKCLSLGKPVLLDDDEMDRVLEKFSTYGVQPP